MKKLFCLLLALVMVFSLLPMAAMATESEGGEGNEGGEGGAPIPEPVKIPVTLKYYSSSSKIGSGGSTFGSINVEVGEGGKTINTSTYGYYVTIGGKLYECKGYLVGGGTSVQSSVKLTQDWTAALTLAYVPHVHKYRQSHNRIHHWDGCACGKIINKETHVDPATDDDKICTCGYKFSNNANLTTLWLTNVRMTKKFNKDTTDYVGSTLAYKDVTSTKITARAFDSLATVEMPASNAINDGTTKFEIVVTAEDKTTTKTYTVTVTKASKADGATISSAASLDGDGSTTVAPRVTTKKNLSTIKITDGIAKKLITQATSNESTKIVIAPKFNKWTTTKSEMTIPASVLADLAKETKADLVIDTSHGDLTIPHDVLTELSKGDVVITTTRSNMDFGYSVTVGGEEFTSDKLTFIGA